MMLSQLSDQELMSAVVGGAHDAFAELVSRHTSVFFNLAYRTLQNQSDAEDVVQAAFIKLWQVPTVWNPRKSQFTTWFYRVIINACHDHLRKKHVTREVPQLDDEAVQARVPLAASEQTQLEQSQADRWRQYCLETAIKQLPMSQRDAINLVVYSGLPQKQAAQVMGVSLKALESLLVRAKKSMALTIRALPPERSSVQFTSLSTQSEAKYHETT